MRERRGFAFVLLKLQRLRWLLALEDWVRKLRLPKSNRVPLDGGRTEPTAHRGYLLFPFVVISGRVVVAGEGGFQARRVHIQIRAGHAVNSHH